ncbi:MAG: DNA polymerase III subunit psi [Paraglaciecola sp.]|nr:DNA polymerase III subunit psi [Paraglaciecola sp.]
MLSDYQRAVLTELGVMCWQTQDAAQNKRSQHAQKLSDVAGTAPKHLQSNSQVTKANALEKLNQLKQVQERVSYKDKIIFQCEKIEPAPAVLNDILLALEMDNHAVVYLTAEQTKLAKDYALLWSMQHNEIEFSSNTLFTPPINDLRDPVFKKTLWQVLQKVAEKTS